MTAVADPIAAGWAVDLAAKSLELLHVAAPNAKRIAVLMAPSANHEPMVKEAQAAAGAIGVTIIPVMARSAPADLNDAFATMQQDVRRPCCSSTTLEYAEVVQLADAVRRLPAIYNFTGFVDLGGLLSYSANFTELTRQAAIYVDKILKGASPRTCLWNSRHDWNSRSIRPQRRLG